MSEEQDVKQKILVVDDEASVREFIERALGYAGYQVDLASDGDEALQALSEKKYDLLLTDIVMPDVDGITLSLKVAKDYPETKILMMSGYTDQRERAHNLDILVQGVIAKPFSLEDLCKIVEDVFSEDVQGSVAGSG